MDQQRIEEFLSSLPEGNVYYLVIQHDNRTTHFHNISNWEESLPHFLDTLSDEIRKGNYFPPINNN